MNPTEWMYELMQTASGRFIAVIIMAISLVAYIYCIYLEEKYG